MTCFGATVLTESIDVGINLTHLAMDQSHSAAPPHMELSPILLTNRDLPRPQLVAAAVAVGVVVLFVFFLGGILDPKDRRRLPPGPRPWPIIGNLNLISLTAHQDLQKLAKKYGPIFYLRFGSKDAVVVSSPKIAKEILKMHDIAFASRPQYTQGDILFYGNQTVITATYGPFWRYAKKVFTLDLLTNKRIHQFQNVRREEFVNALCSIIEQCKDGEPLCLNTELQYMLMNSLTRMIMNKAYFGPKGTEKNEAAEAAESLKEFVRLIGVVLFEDYIPFLKHFDLQGKKQMRAVAKKIDRFLEGILDEHRQELDSKHHQELMDVVDVLLTRSNGRDEKPFTDDEIKGILLTVVLGGTDSSSQTVEWAMTELLKHPNLLRKAQEELDAVVGRDRLVEEADIPNLKFLGLIVKETLRLHPAFPMLIPHECLESREIEGYHIPVKSQIVVNTYTIHRDPEVWERPLEFDPERFLSTKIDVHGQDFELLPFGSGRRSCPGKALGLVMVEHILAAFIHACNWSLSPGVSSTDAEYLAEGPGFGGRKKHFLEAIASPRLPMDVICGHQKTPSQLVT